MFLKNQNASTLTLTEPKFYSFRLTDNQTQIITGTTLFRTGSEQEINYAEHDPQRKYRTRTRSSAGLHGGMGSK